MIGHAAGGDRDPGGVSGRSRPDSAELSLEAHEFLSDLASDAMEAAASGVSGLIRVLHRCREHFAVDSASVWRAADRTRFRLTAAALTGGSGFSDPVSIVIGLEKVDELLEKGCMFLTSDDVRAGSWFAPRPEARALLVPMGTTEEFSGVLVLAAREDRAWSEADLALAKLLPRVVHHMAINLRLEFESDRRLRLLEMVNQVSLIAAAASADSVAESRCRILDVISSSLGADGMAIWEHVDDGFELVDRADARGPSVGTRVSVPDDKVESLKSEGFVFVRIGSLLGDPIPFDPDTVALAVAIGPSEALSGALSLTRASGRRWVDDEVSSARSAARLIRQMTLRVEAECGIRRRLALEALVSSIAADFVDVTPDSVDSKLDHSLMSLIDFFGLEQASIWRFEGDRTVCRMARNAGGPDELEGRSGMLPDTSRLESRGWDVYPMADLADEVGVSGYADSEHRVLVTAYRGTMGLLGALIMVDPGRRRWSDDEISAAKSISDVFGYARVRLVDLRRRAKRFRTDEILIEMSSRLLEISAEGSTDVIDEALELLRDHLTLASVAVWEIEAGRRMLGCPCEASSTGSPLVSQLAPIRAGDPIIQRIADSTGAIDWHPPDPGGRFPGGLDLVALKILVSDEDTVFLSALPGESGEIDADAIAALSSAAGMLAQLRRRFAAERLTELLRRAERVINEILMRFIDTSVGDGSDPISDAFAEVGELLSARSLELWELDPAGERMRRREVWKTDPNMDLPGDGTDSIPLGHPAVVALTSIREASEVGFDGADPSWTFVGSPVVIGSDVVGGLLANFGRTTLPRSELTVLMGVLDSFAALIAQMRTRMWAESALLNKVESDKRLRKLATRLVRTSSDDTDAGDEAFRLLCDTANIDHASLWRVSTPGDEVDIALVNEVFGSDVLPVPDTYASMTTSAGDLGDPTRSRRDSGQWTAESAPGVLPGLLSSIAPAGERRVAAFGQSVDDTHSLYLVVSRPGREAFNGAEVDFFKSAASMLAEHDNRVTAERWFSAGIDFAPMAITMRDSDMRLISCNPAYERLVGRSLDELRGTDLRGVLAAPDAAAHMVRQEQSPDQDHLTEEVRYVRPDGSVSWGRIKSTPVQLPGRRDPFRLTYIEDTTTSRRRRELLEWQATHDELTGLPNRRLFLRMANSRLEKSRDHAMLVLDLDRFKVVNDSLGHSVGDQLLVTCADRIRLSLRPGDVVCRLGGDEFAILLTPPADLATASAVADRLLSLLREPARIADVDVFPSASIGIAVPDGDDGVDDLLRHADAAMYQSKARGRDRCTSFDSSMRDAVLDRIRTETDLRLAIDNGQLEVHYQPEVMLSSGVIVGAEALVRWRHPEWGLLTAGSFINVAEESGIVVDLGRWVLGVATAQAADWLSQGHDIIIRVNLSARQVRPAVVAEVEDALHAAGLAPDRLCLELTETAIMDDVDESEQILARLHDLGVKLAIDDFGTGFSSLAYLKRLPVDILKIDRSFVDGVGVDPDDTAIVESVIGLAGTLNLEVVAEGIEDPTQVRELLRLGCDRGQGFHLARPAPADDIELLLERSRLL